MYSYFSGTGTTLIWASFLSQLMYCCSKVWSQWVKYFCSTFWHAEAFFPPLLQWDCSPSTKTFRLQRKAWITASVVHVQQGQDTNSLQYFIDSWKRKGNLKVDILKKHLCLDLDSDLNICIAPVFFHVRSANSVASFGVQGTALLFPRTPEDKGISKYIFEGKK